MAFSMDNSGPGISQAAAGGLTSDGPIPVRCQDNAWLGGTCGAAKNTIAGLGAWKTLFEGSLNHEENEIGVGATVRETRSMRSVLENEPWAGQRAKSIIEADTPGPAGKLLLQQTLQGERQDSPLPTVAPLPGRSQRGPEAGLSYGLNRNFTLENPTERYSARQDLSKPVKSTSSLFAVGIQSRLHSQEPIGKAEGKASRLSSEKAPEWAVLLERIRLRSSSGTEISISTQPGRLGNAATEHPTSGNLPRRDSPARMKESEARPTAAHRRSFSRDQGLDTSPFIPAEGALKDSIIAQDPLGASALCNSAIGGRSMGAVVAGQSTGKASAAGMLSLATGEPSRMSPSIQGSDAREAVSYTHLTLPTIYSV